MAGVERRVKRWTCFLWRKGTDGCYHKEQRASCTSRKVQEGAIQSCGPDNSLTNERCSEHLTGQHKAQIKPGSETASVEASSCGDTRHQAGITFILSRSSGLVFKQNKGPATKQAKAVLAGETWDIALLKAVLMNSSLASCWPVALNT